MEVAGTSNLPFRRYELCPMSFFPGFERIAVFDVSGHEVMTFYIQGVHKLFTPL
jgi:hypothetical protein